MRMGGRKAGGQLDHLPGEIGGSLEIALVEGGSGIFIATVGAKIAGGSNSRGLRHGPGMRERRNSVNVTRSLDYPAG